MGRIPRIDVGNVIYHVINRANARLPLFENNEDYQLFEEVLEEAKDKFNMRILAYCIMPNHWHLVIYPKNDGDVSRFMQWLTLTHTQRWHAQHNTTGLGHLYQGRYKSLSRWPIDMPSNYVKLVNEPQTSIELESLRFSVSKGKPYGKESWTNRIVDKFNLKLTLRSRGRPKKRYLTPFLALTGKRWRKADR